MKKSDIAYTVGCSFTAAVSFFYCCTMWFSIKLPRYYPTLHEWKWGKVEDFPSQDWYGAQVFAYLTGGIVALVVYILCRRAGSKDVGLKPGTTRNIALAAIGVIIFCMGYTFYYEATDWQIL